MLRPALLALGVVAFATACATDSLTAPEAAPVTMLAMTADPSASTVLAPEQTILLTTSLQHANERAVGRRVTWTSSNQDVATVNANGTVLARAEGEATITAASNQGTEQLRVIVRRPGAEAAPSDTTTPTPADSTPEQQPAPTDSAAPTPPSEPAPQPAPDPVVTPTQPSPLPTGPAELPRSYVDVRMPAVTGRSIFVPAGASIQAAIEEAQLGDEIVLQAGATYVETVRLRNKSGSGWITIRTNGSLPAEGTRVTPSHAPQMAKLVAYHYLDAALSTDPGAHHYRLVGLEVTTLPSTTWTYGLVALGDGNGTQRTLESQPHHLVLDRMYIHGHATLDFQRCVGLNSAETAVVDSWISDCHSKNMDSQAIGGWAGTGPYKIVNNYLEGASENIMFGGADPSIPNALPSDIEIRRNDIVKPKGWRGVWSVKNLMELKIGRRILIEGNVFENNWPDAQVGFAIVMKSTNQDGSAPWSETSDVTFRYNIVRNVAHGLSLVANPEASSAIPAARITIAHNLFERVGDGDYPGGRLWQVSGIRGLTISNNTGFGNAFSSVLFHDTPVTDLVMENNVFGSGPYVLTSADGKGIGTDALNAHATSWIFRGNVLVGARADWYPAGNEYPSTPPLAGSTSAGADVAAISRFTSGVVMR